MHGNGGYLTHQHALVVSTTAQDYAGDPEPRDTARPGPPVVRSVDGEVVTVETATVEHSRDGAPAQAWLVARTASAERYSAATAPGDPASARELSLERPRENVGRAVRVTTKGEFAVVEDL